MKELAITSAALQGTAGPEPKRRGNRKTRVPEILEVAIKVFAAEGNAAFTQRRVAHEAGIRLSTLQHYFGTRDELLRSAIEELAKRHLGAYRDMAKDKTKSPDARLELIIDRAFDMFSGTDRYTSSFALHCWSLAEQDPFVNDLIAEIHGEFVELFAGLVAKINPSLTSSECTLRAGLIFSHMNGLIAFFRRCGDNMPDRDAFRLAIKTVWKALSNASQ